jgi:hypothetical protein
MSYLQKNQPSLKQSLFYCNFNFGVCMLCKQSPFNSGHGNSPLRLCCLWREHIKEGRQKEFGKWTLVLPTFLKYVNFPCSPQKNLDDPVVAPDKSISKLSLSLACTIQVQSIISNNPKKTKIAWIRSNAFLRFSVLLEGIVVR